MHGMNVRVQIQPGKIEEAARLLREEVTEDEIAEILRKEDLAEACQSLIDLTLERGATDNVTLVVIRAEKADADLDS